MKNEIIEMAKIMWETSKTLDIGWEEEYNDVKDKFMKQAKALIDSGYHKFNGTTQQVDDIVKSQENRIAVLETLNKGLKIKLGKATYDCDRYKKKIEKLQNSLQKRFI